VCPHFSGGATVLHIEDIDTLFLTPHKGCELTLNNIPVKTALGLLKNEFKILADKEGLDLSLPSKAFEPEGYSHKVAKQLKARLATLVTSYRGKRKLADKERRSLESVRMKEMGEQGYRELEKKYRHKSLVDLVRNRDNLDDYRITPLKIVRLSDPIFTKGLSPWGGAPFFAGIKRISNGMVHLSVRSWNFMDGILSTLCCPVPESADAPARTWQLGCPAFISKGV